ncbi:MAG: TRAM domain-containing protein [Ardenticatenaceae bacterium]|nr:TRAM domain-containing protein [Ardenticatenaceae bacterium]HBY98757.1 PIN domain nuclease [Chloroflexota bacterium]
MSFEFILRLVGGVILASVGWWIGEALSAAANSNDVRSTVVLALAGLALGLLLTPYFTTRPMTWARRTIRQIPANHLLAGTIGLALGLIIAALLALPLSLLPRPLGSVLPLAAAIVFAYLGITTMVTRERDLITAVQARLGRDGRNGSGRQVLLDTSVIIDGRIADISQTGFIDGTMVVPRFILNELQHIADSSDPLRRNRGRRGLEMLNKLQKDSVTPIEITDLDAPEFHEADTKLIALARQLDAAILTNDYNLNKVAELQGVRVLNINELANAVKTVLLPGESLRVRVIQEGKELEQGVGYLDDGTMVVIEDGKRHIGETCEVLVTRVLQTVAGRMIFAQLPEKERVR